MSITLGLDIGTTAVKALAVDATGAVLATVERFYDTQTPHPGWVEQDAEDWWRLTCECVREVVCRAGACTPPAVDVPLASDRTAGGVQAPALQVSALAVSTQGDTIVPLDHAGRPLAPAITWMDSRATAQVAAMNTEADLWFRLTGSAPAPFAAAASILWWRDEQPEVFRRAQRFALVADFVIARLTGRPVLDAPNASRTLLYDITRRQWAPELLERAGIEEGQLATAAESGTVVGPVLPEVAADLGLSPETQVVLGGHDQTCAAVGCGVTRPGSLMLSCGTAWVVLAATEQALFDDTHSVQGYCHATRGGYAVLGAFAGGNLLKWFRDTLWAGDAFTPPSRGGRGGDAVGVPGRVDGVPPPTPSLTGGGDGYSGDPYDLITGEAAAALASERPPLLFLPHFYGATGPVRCQAAKGAWAGLTLSHTRGDMALALLNGVAVQTALTVRNLARQGAASDDIRMIGGGARSRFWAQLVANATGIAIRLPEVREAAAYGAALLAATAMGAFGSLDEATAGLTIREAIEPAGAPDAELLDRHTELLRALAPLWEELGRV